MTGARVWGFATDHKRSVIIGAAALAAALVAVVILMRMFSPVIVPESERIIVPQPPQIPVNGPSVAAPEGTDFTIIEEVSEEFAPGFAGDIIDVRTRVGQKEKPGPATVVDGCLLEWAKANLEVLATAGAYQVVTVCERPTAVLAGPAGADNKVLVYGSLEDGAPEGMEQTLAESTSDRMAFVAVRTADGRAQLLAAAELPVEG